MVLFEINCTTCSFSTVIEGDVDAVSDQIEEHRADVTGDPEDHFMVAWCQTCRVVG